MKTQDKRQSDIEFGRPIDIESGFFGQPLAPPPLAIPRRPGMPRAAKIILGGFVIALIASISVMAFALTQDIDEADEAAKWKIIREVEVELAAIKARIAAEAATETAVVEPDPSASAEATAGSSISKAEDPEPVETTTPVVKKRPFNKPVDNKPVDNKPVDNKPVEEKQPDPKPKDELDKWLNPGGVDENKKSDLQKTLTRKQVQAGMNKVAGAVKSCGNNMGGNVTVAVTIKGNGKVQSATVVGSHAGTSVGSCAARYVRRASFPAFADPSLRVKYPFSL